MSSRLMQMQMKPCFSASILFIFTRQVSWLAIVDGQTDCIMCHKAHLPKVDTTSKPDASSCPDI